MRSISGVCQDILKPTELTCVEQTGGHLSTPLPQSVSSLPPVLSPSLRFSPPHSSPFLFLPLPSSSFLFLPLLLAAFCQCTAPTVDHSMPRDRPDEALGTAAPPRQSVLGPKLFPAFNPVEARSKLKATPPASKPPAVSWG